MHRIRIDDNGKIEIPRSIRSDMGLETGEILYLGCEGEFIKLSKSHYKRECDYGSILNKYKSIITDNYNVKLLGICKILKNKDREKLKIIVEFERSVSMLQYLSLEKYLSQILNENVNLVTLDKLSSQIIKDIFDNIIFFWGNEIQEPHKRTCGGCSLHSK